MLHILGTDSTKARVEAIIENLWEKDISVSHEIIPYDAFANGETRVILRESVRGKDVVLVGDVVSKLAGASLNDRYMQLKLIIQVAKNHGATSVSCVLPFYPYSRQDKPVHAWLKQRSERAPSSAQLIAQELEVLWIEYCITLDVHNPATAMAFIHTKFVDLYTGWFIEEVMDRLWLWKDIVLSGADQWSDKKISSIAKDLEVEYIIALKKRDFSQKSVVDGIHIYGDITGKHVLIHDDMVDTGGTLCRLLETMQEKNPASISIAIAHGLFNGPALERFEKAHAAWTFQKMYITDSIIHENLPEYIEVVDTSTLLSNTLHSIATGGSIAYNAGR